MDRNDIKLAFAFGGIVATIVVLGLIERFSNSTISSIYQWQTLIAGVLAVVVGVITILVIHIQGKEQRLQYIEAFKSKRWAMRARLPDALVAISTYCQAVIVALNDRSSQLPIPPTEAAETLKMACEFVESLASQRIFELLKFYQVHNSRLRGFYEKERPRLKVGPEWNQVVYDAAWLKTLNDSLYEYARDETPQGPNEQPSYEEMMSGLKQAVGFEDYVRNEDSYEEVVERIKIMYGVNLD